MRSGMEMAVASSCSAPDFAGMVPTARPAARLPQPASTHPKVRDTAFFQPS